MIEAKDVVMSEQAALAFQRKLETLLAENGIHYTVKWERKPDLRFIYFDDISIKVKRQL